MKLIWYPMAALWIFLVSGCASTFAPEPEKGPPFCYVEEPREFTQEELEWRAAHAPTNLRKDGKTNATGVRECGWKPPAN
jgi:hypothetical protein